MPFRKKTVTTNEFNQVIEGTSLTKEAWKRLRKNKMAIFGMVVVIIYALLALFADFLPLYPYDEAITEHQHLRPSLTKTAGELMMNNKMQEVFFDAWKSGRLVLSDEDNEKINGWIKNDKTNSVWALLLEEGTKQLEAGTFQFSSSDQKAIDRVQKKIDQDINITLDSVKADIGGKSTALDKLSTDQLVSLYTALIGAKEEAVRTSLDNEIRSGIKNALKQNSTDATDEELNAQTELDFGNLSAKEYAVKANENLVGKIESTLLKTALKNVKAELQANPSLSFPFKEEMEMDHGITIRIEAQKKHDRKYILGTDYLGRDMLSRIIYGGQVSIAIGLVGTITSVLIGILVGAIAGYKGGRVDYYLMRFVDIMYGLPYMLLVIICMAIFGRSTLNLFFALAMVSWLTIARMVRGQVMSLKNQEYVEAAKSMGASTLHIILHHMIPNSLSVIIVYSTIRIPNFIMQESFLSFLGLGVQAPYASWGSLIGDAVNSMTLYPWKLIFPSLAMVTFLFAMNFFGDGLRDAFDPQSKNQL